MRWLPLLALVAAGCAAPAPAPSPPPPPAPASPSPSPSPAPTPSPGSPATAASTPLLARLGGDARLAAFVDDLLARAGGDPALELRFVGMNQPKLRKGLLELLGAYAGGPQVYKGASMKAAHAGMSISEEEYAAFEKHAAAAAQKLSLGPSDTEELLGFFKKYRRDVILKRPTPDERMGRIENRLASIEQRLLDLSQRPDAGAAATGGGRPAPELKPAPLPDPATVNPAFKGEKWTAEEKALAPALLRRLGESHASAEGEARDDLVGQRLPKTRFLSSTGDVVDLRDFEGKKKVVLVILRGFTGSICIHCSTQAIALTNAADKFKAAGAEVALVYPGPADSIPAFVNAARNLRQGFAPKLPILLDVDLAAVRALRIEGGLAKPTSLIVDEAGLIRFVYVGRQPADRPSASDLLAALERIAKGQE